MNVKEHHRARHGVRDCGCGPPSFVRGRRGRAPGAQRAPRGGGAHKAGEGGCGTHDMGCKKRRQARATRAHAHGRCATASCGWWYTRHTETLAHLAGTAGAATGAGLIALSCTRRPTTSWNASGLPVRGGIPLLVRSVQATAHQPEALKSVGRTRHTFILHKRDVDKSVGQCQDVDVELDFG